MKIDLPVAPPADVKQGWEGQFEIFSWYNFVLNVPTNVFLVTTLKENGLSNVQLNAWGMLIGSGTEPKFILQVMNSADTLRLIERNREFVINLPSRDLRDRLLKAAEHFDAETDEISAAGFTAEKAGLVKAPRIRECFAHYECVLDWARPVEEKVGVNTLVQGSVVRAAVDDEFFVDDVAEAYRRRGLVYHFSEFYYHAKRSCSGGGGFCGLDVNGLDFGA